MTKITRITITPGLDLDQAIRDECDIHFALGEELRVMFTVNNEVVLIFQPPVTSATVTSSSSPT